MVEYSSQMSQSAECTAPLLTVTLTQMMSVVCPKFVVSELDWINLFEASPNATLSIVRSPFESRSMSVKAPMEYSEMLSVSVIILCACKGAEVQKMKRKQQNVLPIMLMGIPFEIQEDYWPLLRNLLHSSKNCTGASINGKCPQFFSTTNSDPLIDL